MSRRVTAGTAWAVLIIATATTSATVHAHGAGAKPRGAARVTLPPDALVGEWWTEDREGRVRFERRPDGTYRGVTSWRAPGPSTPDSPHRDTKNPDPKLRGRSTLGIVIIWNLTFDDGEYENGHVYNPRDGDTYGFQAELLDRDTLKIRGFLGISLLGQSQVWKRYK